MSVKNLIKSRRTTYQFLEKTVTTEIINNLLNSAIWAPNHKLTQPWRFWVIGRQTQRLLADIYAENRAQKKFEKGSSEYVSSYEKAIDKFIKIPQVIFVGQKLNENLIIRKEDYAACSCAIQNIQLSAWEEGIGVQWSTGPVIDDARTFKLLDVEPDSIELIGALYMGYPKETCQSERKSIDQVTVYLD